MKDTSRTDTHPMDGFPGTLDAVGVVFSRNVLLKAFAVCAILLEIGTVFYLRSLKSGALGTHVFAFWVGNSALFLLGCLAVSSISYEVKCRMGKEKSEDTFPVALFRRPGEYLFPPLIILSSIIAIFWIQAGSIYLIEVSNLPGWLFSILYLLQFFAVTADIGIFFLFAIYLFLWVPHIEASPGTFSTKLRSFQRIVKKKACKALCLTAFWAGIAVISFIFIFFPLWKISVMQTLDATNIAMGERFEKEIIGKDTLLSDVIVALGGKSLTPAGMFEELNVAVASHPENSLDKYRMKGIPSAGFLFLAALTLSFAIPFCLAIALFAAGGVFSYRYLISSASGATTRNVAFGVPSGANSALTQSAVHSASYPAKSSSLPHKKPRMFDEETFVEEIQLEPIDASDNVAPPTRRDTLDEYVNFDYADTKKDTGIEAMAESTGFFSTQQERDDKDTKKQEKAKDLRDPKSVAIPEQKKKTNTLGDGTIFDLLDLTDGDE